MNVQVYHFVFTIDQINEMVACMNTGPFGRVQAIVQEFQRQVQAQQAPPPKGNGDAQGDSAGVTT
ncbi:MAG: hypothetical protein HRJ53_04915 [Acidobacteria bacterium Pan2503]|uniref:Uncharacterized protein n=1 Tax=Candidatus Acidiferrum panamense TaxID=2741543 RepID=A0A7V8NN16_9BACT|nr:hypothetical protein [Candidatus Acidoferrum panamensis]